MNTPQTYDVDTTTDPLDMVESILTEEGLEFERTPEGDLGFALTGDWRTYEMWFSWRPEGECLQLCCSLDVEAGSGQALPVSRLAGLYELLCLVNQHVWFGHFELFSDPEVETAEPKSNLGAYDVIFRHTLALSPLENASVVSSAHMINSAA